MTKVTLHEGVIQEAVREAITKIISGVDLERTKNLCRENIQLALLDAVEIKDAFICVHQDQPALQLQVGFSGRLSMLLDFKGNCVSMKFCSHRPLGGV
jgi:hypothetical protein